MATHSYMNASGATFNARILHLEACIALIINTLDMIEAALLNYSVSLLYADI